MRFQQAFLSYLVYKEFTFQYCPAGTEAEGREY